MQDYPADRRQPDRFKKGMPATVNSSSSSFWKVAGLSVVWLPDTSCHIKRSPDNQAAPEMVIVFNTGYRGAITADGTENNSGRAPARLLSS